MKPALLAQRPHSVFRYKKESKWKNYLLFIPEKSFPIFPLAVKSVSHVMIL